MFLLFHRSLYKNPHRHPYWKNRVAIATGRPVYRKHLLRPDGECFSQKKCDKLFHIGCCICPWVLFLYEKDYPIEFVHIRNEHYWSLRSSHASESRVGSGRYGPFHVPAPTTPVEWPEVQYRSFCPLHRLHCPQYDK